MDQLQPNKNDLDVLRDYTFQEPKKWGNEKFNIDNLDYNWRLPGYNRRSNEILLGVKEGKLVSVNSTDVTCWNLFLRCFGFGKLSKTHISMKNIVSHLSKYNWTTLKNEDKALLNIRKIATNTLYPAKGAFAGDPVPSDFVKEYLTLKKTNYGNFYLSESTTARDFSKQIFRESQLGRIFSGSLSRTNQENACIQVRPDELLNNVDKINGITLKLLSDCLPPFTVPITSVESSYTLNNHFT